MRGEPNVLYQTVGDLVLKSEDYIIKPSTIVPAVDAKKETLKEKAAKFLATLSDVRQKELLFNLFSRNGSLKATEKSLEDYSLQELNLIIGSDLSRKMSLYQSIDRTETIAGSVVLSTMLSTPVSDISTIQKRQRLIKFLLQNETIFNHLDALVKAVKSGQGSLLNCWNPEAELDENLRKLWYTSREVPGASFWNKSAKSHQLTRVMLLWGTGVNAVAIPIGLTALAIGLPIMISQTREAGAQAVLALGGTFYGGTIAYAGKLMYDQFNLMQSVLRNMHKRLKDISDVCHSFDEMYLTIGDYNELHEGLSLVENMSNFVQQPKVISNELVALKDLLNKSVFEQEKFGIFSHAGNVLAAYEYLGELKESFSAPLEAMGEIDAYLAIVKLIKEHQNKPSGFCFVDFVDQNEPLIQLKGVWSTLVGSENAKPATIVLGGEDKPNNAMFTGPNGSGKSIVMKAIVSCDVLGRTFGIAPAKAAKMSLFKKVYTYVNVKEDPRLGQSLFMAEKARGEDILNRLSMNPNEKVIIIIDEPYNGTISDSSETLTYDLAGAIAKYPNAVCLLATHRRKPADLADETNKFTNYHFKIIEHDDNTIERTFELASGKCDWWYSDDARRDRYIKLFN